MPNSETAAKSKGIWQSTWLRGSAVYVLVIIGAVVDVFGAFCKWWEIKEHRSSIR